MLFKKIILVDLLKKKANISFSQFESFMIFQNIQIHKWPTEIRELIEQVKETNETWIADDNFYSIDKKIQQKLGDFPN